MSNPTLYTVKYNLDDTDDDAYHVRLTDKEKALVIKRLKKSGTKFEINPIVDTVCSYEDLIEILDDDEVGAEVVS